MSRFNIKNKGSGLYLNLHTATKGTAVPKACGFSLWNLTSGLDQLFVHMIKDGHGLLALGRDQKYVLNCHSKDHSCIAWPLATASMRDSLYTTETEDGKVRIKLVHRGLYLTAVSKSMGARLVWAPKAKNDLQAWSFETVGSVPPTNVGYVYPTPAGTRKLTQSYKAIAHPALDIGGAGAPLHAIADGVVAFVQSSGHSWRPSQDNSTTNKKGSMASLGHCIAINYANPDTGKRSGHYARTIYAHMAGVPLLKPGDRVTMGQLVGAIGNTGRSSGPHLHFVLAVGDASALAPGKTGWIGMNNVPHINPQIYFPDYR